ncbi:protein OXIDATIVE STRESS 3 LIKE 2 isoform X1 [Ricinus communis]|uniref:protein OXIDATIVE STRESS 3 LIKE 2 isoform X1 n=1 Tax=Ricinus communis TaxID=3988 RepID=UPI00201AF3F3|nr:protein OXIDATIVE STRESS 3 LIKE 2 isoform X1 [Ricinus communis]
MDEGNKEQMLQAPALVLKHNRHAKHQDQWMIMEGDEIEGDIYNTSSSFGNSSTTNGSTSSSSDLVDDASSPTSTLSTSSSNSTAGPLFELSELMAHLPIKRGLSSFYQGKSQSFTSLSRVASIEDLPKKETPCRRKMKASKSCANGLDSYKPYTLPKAIISKKVPRSCLSFPGRRGSFLSNSRPPLSPIQKKI